MTDSKNHGPESDSLQGRLFRPASPSDLLDALNRACDYRGDVQLGLRSGATIEGYVFNCCPTASSPYVQVFPKGESGIREILFAEILTIAFTGEDTATGKSWEAWVAKQDSQRQAESDAAAADARARGNL